MLEYQNILTKVNEVIAYSQETPANAENLLKTWAEAKEDLSNRFLDGQLIKNFGLVEMKLSPKEKEKQFNDFVEPFRYNYEYIDFVDFLNANKETFFDNTVKENYITRNGDKINAGMRLSKAFKFFINDDDMLYKYQTEVSRLIQNNVLKGELCVSIHPLDFLSSSENNYNWRSCHALNGEYRCGNLSYMVDKTTMITYIKGEGEHELPHFPNSVLWNSKKWRMLLFTSENYEVFFAGRQYPFDLGTTALDAILECLIPGAAKKTENFWYCENRSWSYWHKDQITRFDYEDSQEDSTYLTVPYVPIHHNLYKLKDIIIDNPGSQHFNDLLHSSCYTPYYAWSHNTRHKPIIAIGGRIPCPCCGKEDHYVEVANMMGCSNCYNNYAQEDDDHKRCAECGELHHIDDMYWVDRDEYYICASCYDDSYGTCDSCGEVFPLDDLVRRGDEYFCEDCDPGDE